MITELSVADIVTHYQMLPHPEGGYYTESYRSKESFANTALPKRFSGDRNFATSIYFLLEQGNFSAFHRIQSDETWHFYAGQCLEIFVLQENQDLQIIRLGNNILGGETFQTTVPAGAWFASRPSKETEFSLVGCTVSPGFDFQDFELAKSEKLSIAHPKYQSLIIELCRQ
jgi:uncharacterized protein